MGFLYSIFGAKTHKGYTINYNYPYWMKCPCCGGTIYHTKEDIHLCYCPRCKDFTSHE